MDAKSFLLTPRVPEATQADDCCSFSFSCCDTLCSHHAYRKLKFTLTGRITENKQKRKKCKAAFPGLRVIRIIHDFYMTFDNLSQTWDDSLDTSAMFTWQGERLQLYWCILIDSVCQAQGQVSGSGPLLRSKQHQKQDSWFSVFRSRNTMQVGQETAGRVSSVPHQWSSSTRTVG